MSQEVGMSVMVCGILFGGIGWFLLGVAACYDAWQSWKK